MEPTTTPRPTQAAIAAHRYGLGEATLAVVGGDAGGWLLAQLGPADVQRGDAELPSSAQALRQYAEFLARQRQPAAAAMRADPAAAPTAPLRAAVQADLRARLLTAATTTRPFAERLALFWANHFTVSAVESRCGAVAVGSVCLWPPLSSGGARVTSP